MHVNPGKSDIQILFLFLHNNICCGYSSEGEALQVPITDVFVKKSENTDNPLYTDTRYNDKIRYNDTLTVTKPSRKR